MTTTYTSTYRFPKPDFKSPNWAPQIQGALDAIDAAIRNSNTDIDAWENDTLMEIGVIRIDNTDVPSSFWINTTEHTSAVAPTTFEQDRTANPTYWTPYSFGLQPRGAWTNNTAYRVNDISYDSSLGVTGICNNPHTSNAAGTILDDSANWDFIVNLPTLFTAESTTFTPPGGMSSTNVQDAIEEIFSEVSSAFVSANIASTPANGLVSTNVQDAINELQINHLANLSLITDAFSAITTGIVSAGDFDWQPWSGVRPGWVISNATTIGSAVSGASQRANNDCFDAFVFLWNTYSNTECPVSGGRGGNAGADWSAGKTIGTFDMRGNFGGLGVDTMSGSASSRLSGALVVSGSTTTAGSILGETTHINSLSELPTGITSVNAAQAIQVATASGAKIAAIESTNSYQATIDQTSGAGAFFHRIATSGNTVTITTMSGNNSISVTSNNTSGAAHNNVPRSRTGFWYMKL
jgi:hypothetical protein